MKKQYIFLLLILLNLATPIITMCQEWHLLGNNGTTPGTNFVGTTDNFDLVLKTNNSEKVRILTGGNVGIGTATPADKLHVNISDSVNTRVRITNIKSPNGLQVGVDAKGHGSVNMADNLPLNLSTNGTHRIHINDISGTNRGYVGIGNNFNAPTCRLQITENSGNDN